MSTPSSAEARAPSRERGQVRVAAIMEAGAALFREKGFDAVTMSEVAARSGTAFGSLYRFFPSKEALADALLKQYAQRTLDRLRELAERATGMSPGDLSAELVAFIAWLRSERGFVIAVVEARGGGDDKRARFRAAVRDAVSAILRKALPGLGAAESEALAIVTLHVLKGVAAAADEPPSLRDLAASHYRELLRSYFARLSDPLEGVASPTHRDAGSP